MICRFCGYAFLELNDKYCSQCGRDLKNIRTVGYMCDNCGQYGEVVI